MIRAATADDPLRIAVLASGRGSNLAALMERLDPSVAIVAVASNRADAVALSRAREEDIETAVFPRGEVVVLPGRGHNSLLFDPESITRVIERIRRHQKA